MRFVALSGAFSDKLLVLCHFESAGTDQPFVLSEVSPALGVAKCSA